MAVPVYRGSFGKREAERLLWRAGFGPKPGEAAAFARLGLRGAVDRLVNPPSERLSGPAPRVDGGPLAPQDAWGHDVLWWLDRMVRTRRPLVERMTLVWHDWFATSNGGVGSQKLMLRQNELFRRRALGSFRGLLLDVTKDPAMILWLSSADNTKWEPNENYARELMELFTLGVNRGYTEQDVREQARSLTGFRYDWTDAGPVRFRFDPDWHDTGQKTIFGKRGNWDWQDACRLCLEHPRHSSFFVRKLWSYFVPVPPSGSTQTALQRLYVRSGYDVGSVVSAILKHPAFYTGPRMVKPPIVVLAGMLRAKRRGVDTDAWSWLGNMAGQRLFYPPNVSGWDDSRWLDTATFRGRWWLANYVLEPFTKDPQDDRSSEPLHAGKLVDRAVAFWGSPTITGRTRDALTAFARRALATAEATWEKETYPVLIQNALRQLVVVSPDYQTC
ncbi:MAG TPA: DUF1800 domain-containing protein [Gaiellaceae bacterium]|nr:DUF1800 domain-containing protein [Gaiellaceae bacterium]